MSNRILVKSKRGRAGAKRLDVAQMREAMRDGRLWSGLGVVRLYPGELQHWEIVTDEEPDVLIDVELVPNRERLVCRLGIAAGAVWKIPAPDTEVALLIPQGDLEADPIIVASIEAPPGLLALNKVVIVAPAGGEVLIYDGSGTPEKLVKRSEFMGHGHAVAGGTGAPSGPTAIAGYLDGFDGTAVLKAK